ncbi:DUF6933 domain-containing protein [Saccharospirillum impatiens]|uniref:DUF6933 domain-containing protein n=1 Tax=Saccharospirillum impatiens TaxID=169438 RepID=UPI0004284261|nr:hypothetical protein [Saccharospirillum impatiens]
MIRLHCTKKLIAKLPLDKVGHLVASKPTPIAANDEPESPLSGWHANLITLQRRQCVLFVHDATRFPVFVPCLTKPDFSELEHHFIDGFINTLLKVGVSERQLENAQHSLAAFCCDSQCNRSVQGTMNHMSQDLEHWLWYDRASVADLAPYRTSAWLADRPCTVNRGKAVIWPVKAMLALLDDAYEAS